MLYYSRNFAGVQRASVIVFVRYKLSMNEIIYYICVYAILIRAHDNSII